MKDDWLTDGVIYQIFPDRFKIGHRNTIATKMSLIPEGGIARQWHQKPTKKGGVREFYGGDLYGIIEELNHIQDLSVNILYLTPLFDSPSSHRYDSINYRSISPILGGLEAFQNLVEVCHKRKIKVIVDLVFNHTSSMHPLFIEAYQNPNSPYREYFKFDAKSNEYECWRGVKDMPEWNLRNPRVIEHLITGRNSVLHWWLSQEVDGIRLDCANDLGIEVCELITQTVHEFNSEVKVFGEVFPYASRFAEVMDGVQSYYITSALLSLLQNKITPTQFGRTISDVVTGYGLKKALSSWIMISSHDIPRSLTALNGDIRLVDQAITAMYTLPGIPMIYYGEEIGLTGGEDPFNRGTMEWDTAKWNFDILKKYIHMAIVRKVKPELRYGAFLDLSDRCDNQLVAFIRYTNQQGQFLLVLMNPHDKKVDLRIHIPYSFLFDSIRLHDLQSNDEIVTRMGAVDVSLPPLTSRVYTPKETFIKRYRFYK